MRAAYEERARPTPHHRYRDRPHHRYRDTGPTFDAAGLSPANVTSVMPRRCSRAACESAAVATLTYAYVESTAVLGPLSPFVEPHSYDLCAEHADRLTAPRGWAVVRVEGETAPQPPNDDDLE